jgi:chromate transporter
MTLAVLLALLITFAGLSLVAVGGATAVLPEMHRVLVVEHGWMDDATFAQLYALAQAAPGPNILIASAMGWHVAGAAGLVAATIGMLAPAAVLAWMVGGFTQRLAGHAWLRVVQTGLVPVAVGLMLASGIVMADASGTGPLALAITGASALFVWGTDRNPLWALAAGGVAGLVLG